MRCCPERYRLPRYEIPDLQIAPLHPGGEQETVIVTSGSHRAYVLVGLCAHRPFIEWSVPAPLVRAEVSHHHPGVLAGKCDTEPVVNLHGCDTADLFLLCAIAERVLAMS